MQLLKTEQFNKQRWNQTKWYSINYQQLEVLISSICSNRTIRSAQIKQLDVAILSSSSTETTAITTSENTSPYSQEREAEKQTNKTVIAQSCTSPVAKNESVSDEQTDFELDLSSAAGSRIENEFDGLPCSDITDTKSDSSVSAQQTNCLP